MRTIIQLALALYLAAGPLTAWAQTPAQLQRIGVSAMHADAIKQIEAQP